MLRRGTKYNFSKSRKSRLWFILPLFLFAVGISSFLVLSRDANSVDKPKLDSNSQQAVQTIDESKTLVGRYLFSGTIVLARAVEKFAAGDYAQPFSQLSTFQPEQYDAWMPDLECPVTHNDVSYQEQIDNLVFNCRTEWLTNYSKYFNLTNLANNHSNNMGREGFLETQRNLAAAGVQSVGDYDPSVSENACEVVSLPVRLTGKDAQPEKAELPVAFCAFHYFFRNPKPGEMDVIKQYSDYMPVFGFMHVGVEYLPTAGTEQQNVARSLIDLGSEFVVGNSPHWVQNSEVYKGKPIFYSTGNFMFDQIDDETNRGLSIDVQMGVEYDSNVAKWLELGKQCKARGDKCLEIAKQQNLSKPTLKLVYQPIANVTGNRVVTRKADTAVQAAVEQRLNWSETKKQLGQ